MMGNVICSIVLHDGDVTTETFERVWIPVISLLAGSLATPLKL